MAAALGAGFSSSAASSCLGLAAPGLRSSGLTVLFGLGGAAKSGGPELLGLLGAAGAGVGAGAAARTWW